MFKIEIDKWLPRYLLQDKNGYALARALESGLQIVNDIVEAGVKCIYDIDSMPEWRLDELAWEGNITFDYGADIQTKREWLKHADKFASSAGTKYGLEFFLGAKFKKAVVKEWPEYDGLPYHFSVELAGQYTEENDKWAKEVLKHLKNVRSVLDTVDFNAGESEAKMWALAGAACIGISAWSQSQ